MESLETVKELVKAKINEYLTPMMINDVVRHEFEERVGTVIWSICRDSLKDMIRKELEELKPRIHQMFEQEVKPKLHEFIESKLSDIEKSLRRDIEYERIVRDVFSQIIREKVMNDPEVNAVIQKMRAEAINIVNEKINDIRHNIKEELVRRYLIDFETMKKIIEDLMQRVSRFESQAHLR